MINPTTKLGPLEPKPGYTIPGVGVPGAPTEEQATEAAVEYGWLIAIVIVGVVIVALFRSVTRRIDFQLVGVLVVAGFVTYQIGKHS
jgi:hypothetical protein